MKNYQYLMWPILMSMVLALSLPAHPPTEVKLIYNPETQILTVDILHPTPDIQKHIINEVLVFLNGEEIVRQSFTKQMNKEHHKMACLVNHAKPGDEIVVIAHCNVFGKKKVTYTIPGPGRE